MKSTNPPRRRWIGAAIILGVLVSAACSKSGSDTLDEAKNALAAGDYDAAKRLAFDSTDPNRYAFINDVDTKKTAAEQSASELKFAVEHAKQEGKVKTKATLDRLLASAGDAKTKSAVQKALDGLDAMFPSEDPKKEAERSMPRSPRVESDQPTKKTRVVDEKPPEDGLKKKTSQLEIRAEVREIINTAREEASGGRYRQALELLSMVSGELGSDDRTALAETEESVRSQSAAAFERRVDVARSVVRSEAQKKNWESALETLYIQLADHPSGAAVSALRARLDPLLQGGFTSETAVAALDLAAAGAPDAPADAPPAPKPRKTIPNNGPREAGIEEILFQGDTALAAGDYAAAKAAYLDAAAKATIPALKSDAAGRAEEASRAMGFIERVGVAVAQNPALFKDFEAAAVHRGNVVSADGNGLVLEKEGSREVVAWEALSAPGMRALVGKLGKIPADEKLGAAIFLARARAVKDADLCLKEAVDADPNYQGAVDGILARRRNIDVPSYGFVWHKNQWMTFKEREAQKLADRVQALLTKVETSSSAAERTAASEEIRRLGMEATDSLVLALRERRVELAARLKSMGFAKKLAPIAAEREKLDEARRYALELIFDEVKYFYPYNPPECPAEKAKLYPEVQREVDRRVMAIKELWDSKTAVPLGSAQSTLRLLHENEAQLRAIGVNDIAADADVDPYLALDPKEPEVTIRNCCKSPQERRNWLEFNRKITEFNVSTQTSLTKEDRRLVDVTNQYREMFGRRMLAVNEKILQAARKHSKWMADSGTFSHFSSLPGLRTPFDRMKAEGYTAGIGENIAMAAGPDGAFQGWAHSSGHHRNMLSESHSEFGCVGTGHYWVQNFGAGQEFRANTAWRP